MTPWRAIAVNHDCGEIGILFTMSMSADFFWLDVFTLLFACSERHCLPRRAHTKILDKRSICVVLLFIVRNSVLAASNSSAIRTREGTLAKIETGEICVDRPQTPSSGGFPQGTIFCQKHSHTQKSERLHMRFDFSRPIRIIPLVVFICGILQSRGFESDT